MDLFLKIVAMGVVSLVSGFLVAALGAWPVMISLGTLHSQWAGVPAFGFWATLVLLWAAMVVGRIFIPTSTGGDG